VTIPTRFVCASPRRIALQPHLKYAQKSTNIHKNSEALTDESGMLKAVNQLSASLI
jgi:hypothetical protein